MCRPYIKLTLGGVGLLWVNWFGLGLFELIRYGFSWAELFFVWLRWNGLGWVERSCFKLKSWLLKWNRSKCSPGRVE